MNSEKPTILTINIEGNASGCLYWYQDDITKVYISNVNVRRAYRRKGLGNKLFDIIVSYAKNFDAVYLWVEEHSWVQDWYGRRGFKILPNNYYDKKNKYIWMEKLNKKTINYGI